MVNFPSFSSWNSHPRSVVLRTTLLNEIHEKNWNHWVFKHTDFEKTLVELYEENKISDNMYSILKWRKDVAIDYQHSSDPTTITLLNVEDHLDKLFNYFNHPAHNARFLIFNKILNDENANDQFKEFLKLEFTNAPHADELYFFEYSIRTVDFSGFMRRILLDRFTQHEYHVYFPVPDIPQTPDDLYSGVTPCIRLAQLTLDAAGKFLRSKTNSNDYQSVSLELMSVTTTALEVGQFHAQMKHPVVTPTYRLPESPEADTHTTHRYCYSLHDMGFHAWRYAFQDYFALSSTLFYECVVPYYQELINAQIKSAFENADMDQHAGHIAGKFIDFEIISLANTLIYRLYKGFFIHIIATTHKEDLFSIQNSFNREVTGNLFKSVIKRTFELIQNDAFEQLLSIMLDEHGNLSSTIAYANPANRTELDIRSLMNELVEEAPQSNLSQSIMLSITQFETRNEIILKNALTQIQQKNWADDVFNHTRLEEIIHVLHEEGHISNNDFCILKWRQESTINEPSYPFKLPIIMDMSNHDYRERFIKLFKTGNYLKGLDVIDKLVPPSNNAAHSPKHRFIYFLEQKLRYAAEPSELYFFSYHSHTSIEFYTPTSTSEQTQYQLFTPQPTEKESQHLCTIPSIKLAQFVIDAAAEFMSTETACPYKAVTLVPCKRELSYHEVAIMHSNMMHPVNLFDPNSHCIALHDMGNLAFRYSFQDYFQVAQNLYSQYVVPFYDGLNGYPELQKQFHDHQLDTYTGYVAKKLYDFDTISFAKSPIEKLYQSFFALLTSPSLTFKMISLKRSYNQDVAKSLFKHVIKGAFIQLSNQAFEAIVTLILSKNAFNAQRHPEHNAKNLRVPVIALLGELTQENKDTPLAHALTKIMSEFKATMISDQKANDCVSDIPGISCYAAFFAQEIQLTSQINSKMVYSSSSCKK